MSTWVTKDKAGSRGATAYACKRRAKVEKLLSSSTGPGFARNRSRHQRANKHDVDKEGTDGGSGLQGACLAAFNGSE